MYDKNVIADMCPPSLPTAVVGQEDSGHVDWLGVYNQFHQVGTWEFHVASRRLTWSEVAYRIHGIDPKDTTIPLKAALALFHPQDVTKIEQLMAQAIRTKRGYRYILRLQRPDRQLRLIESIASVKLNASGEVERLVGVVRDITRQIEHENTRVGQTDLLLRMVRSMPTGAALCDREMRYLAWSPSWLSDFGMGPGVDLAGKSHFDLYPGIGPDKRTIAEVVMKGRPLSKERDRAQSPSGAIMLFDWVTQPWQDRFGEIGGAVILTRVHQVSLAPKAEAAEMATG